MKLSFVLQLAAFTSAFVLPNQDVFGAIETRSKSLKEVIWNRADVLAHRFKPCEQDEPSLEAERFHNGLRKYHHEAHYAIDDALAYAPEAVETDLERIDYLSFDAKSWIENNVPMGFIENDPLGLLGGQEETDRPRKGKKGHGHKKGNQTIYELIAKSKYTTKLAKLISDYPDLVEALNNTEARYTVFAPTDRAFKKIPHHAPKPPKEFLEKILLYHVSPDFYPAGRVLAGRTIPTMLKTDRLSDEEVSQRLATQVSLRGLTVNFYSRIVAINIFGSNGVIHGVDSLLFPPPPALKIIDLVPEEFSTLELGLYKTGLIDTLNSTEHKGGTLFAPSNFAFAKLGPRANAFLFSPPGLKYLRALLRYHVVPEKTVYSDHYIEGHPSKEEDLNTDRPRRGPPRGYKHLDLPTLLEDKELAVDVSRYGRLIDIQLNGYTHVTTSDAVAQDGVIHEVNNVLIPPRGSSNAQPKTSRTGRSEWTVEDLIESLEPFVEHDFEPEDL